MIFRDARISRPRTAGSRRLRAFAAAALAAACTLAAPTDAGCLPSASIVGRAAKIQELGGELAKSLTRLRQLASERELYFRRGLGWRTPEAYGFQTRAFQAYFSDRFAGFTSFGPDGAEIGRFVVSYQDRIPWAVYTRSDGHKLTAGYSGGEVTNLEVLFPEGCSITAWDSSFRVAYPGGEATYAMSYQRGDPIVLLSLEAARELRGGEPAILKDLADDLPYAYLTRVLLAASRAALHLEDDGELCAFAIDWFRALAGTPRVPIDARLLAAARSHAEYLVTNAVASRLVGLAASSADPNLFLEIHTEKPGAPGFTGAEVTDRAVHAGYGSAAGETAGFGTPEPVSDALYWYHSIFHRRPFLDLRVRHAAYARAVSAARPGESAGIANWGYDWSAAGPGYVLCPRDGETLVPFSWSGLEAPNPFPGRTRGTGPPISAAFTDPRYRGGTLELYDSGGRSVPLLRTSVAPDPEHFVEVVPEDPLEPGASYTLRFSYGTTVDRSTFRTAPRNPAELVLGELIAALAGDVDVRSMPFDLDEAVRAGERKGELATTATAAGTRVADEKYGFSVLVPEGWTVAERTWQELALAKGQASVSFHLYALGPGKDADDVVSALTKNVEHKLERSEPFGTAHVSGYRREHSWQYAGGVVIYCLVYGDYGVGVYGYGVTRELMDPLVASLEPT